MKNIFFGDSKYQHKQVHKKKMLHVYFPWHPGGSKKLYPSQQFPKTNHPGPSVATASMAAVREPRRTWILAVVLVAASGLGFTMPRSKTPEGPPVARRHLAVVTWWVKNPDFGWRIIPGRMEVKATPFF